MWKEAQTFYILVHIMQRLDWREIYKPEMTKLMHHLRLIEELISTGYVEVFDHILRETDDTSLYPIFGSLILSVFISDI